MKYTGNYNLKKPDGTDIVNIEDFNENADIIDSELKKLNDAIEDLNAENITLPDGKTIAEKLDEIETEIGNIEELDTDTKLSLVTAINQIYQEIIAHKADKANPHSVTKSQVGLGNVDNVKQATKAEFDEHKADKVQHLSYAIATGTNTYTATIQGITTLVEGMSIKVKFQNANTGTATLNINGLGAKEIRKSNGNSLAAGNIKAGQILHLVYTGSVFQLLGEGGEYGNVTPDDVIKGVTFGTEEGLKTGTLELTGNATASQVLTGRTFYTTNPKTILTGSMPNRGAVTHTITTQGGSYTIPAGYHNGSGKVTANFANLVASNIKSGVNIGGVTGTVHEAISGSESIGSGKMIRVYGETLYGTEADTMRAWFVLYIGTTLRYVDTLAPPNQGISYSGSSMGVTVNPWYDVSGGKRYIYEITNTSASTVTVSWIKFKAPL